MKNLIATVLLGICFLSGCGGPDVDECETRYSVCVDDAQNAYLILDDHTDTARQKLADTLVACREGLYACAEVDTDS